jgi:nitrosocyanin
MENNQQVEPTPASKKFNPLIIVALVVVLAAVGFLLLPKSEMKTQEVKSNPEEAQEVLAKNQTESSSVNGETTINLEAGAFYYSQKEIKVKQGEKVKIVMSAKDMMHDFVIDDLSVKSEIAKAGETVTVEFTADKVGTFEYYCSVGQHKQNGQVGNLIVE